VTPTVALPLLSPSRPGSPASLLQSRPITPTHLLLRSPKSNDLTQRFEDARVDATLTSAGMTLGGETCAICLDMLDRDDYAFPCGHRHRLHFNCAIDFMGCALSATSRAGDKGSLPLQVYKRMGVGFRAIDAIENAIRTATAATLGRLCCPLCRAAWPLTDQPLVHEAMNQLRLSSARRHRNAAVKMRQALARMLDRFHFGVDWQRSRLISGLIRLGRNYHNASSFFAVHRHAEAPLTSLITFLRCDEVASLSTTCSAGSDVFRNTDKLRVASLKVNVDKVRTNMLHLWAPDVVSLEITAGGGCAWGLGGSMTAADTVCLSKWLRSNRALRHLTICGLQWEKYDPGGHQLASCVMNKDLQVLDLSHNNLCDASLKRLADALRPLSSKLRVLELDNNCATHMSLASLLRLGGSGRTSVEEWGFRHNKLGDAGCRALAEVRIQQEELWFAGASWDLRNNGITEHGCDWLAPLCRTMVVAQLGCNPLGDDGVSALAQEFGSNLRVLELRQARFGDSGAKALAKSLAGAHSLEKLLLSQNEIGCRGVGDLSCSWGSLPQLSVVDLTSNPLHADGVESIASGMHLWQQPRLRLCLIDVGCGDAGFSKLKMALLEQDQIDRHGWEIELQNNRITNPSYAVEVRNILDILVQ